MKFVTYEKDDGTKIGVIEENTVIDITSLYGNMNELIMKADVSYLREEISKQEHLNRYDISVVKLLPPINEPIRNIICVGWNYLEHFEERFDKSIELPSKPTIFTKATTTISGPYESIALPSDVAEIYDYEAELAVVIGKEGKRIKEEEADDYIFGYMTANDISARDTQQSHGGQWFMGKSFDHTCPTGPWLTAKEEIDDIQNLNISCKVNGEIVQSSNTRLMIFPIKEIISELSQAMTLLPGDIILTGTPLGVGFKRKPPLILKDGDMVEVEVEQLGNIKNEIKKINEE